MIVTLTKMDAKELLLLCELLKIPLLKYTDGMKKDGIMHYKQEMTWMSLFQTRLFHLEHIIMLGNILFRNFDCA